MKHPNRNAPFDVDICVVGEEDDIDRATCGPSDPYFKYLNGPGVRSFTTRRHGVPVKITKRTDVG